MFIRFVLDLPSTPRTTLGTVDTNICLNKINETNIDGKYVSSDVISDGKACSVYHFIS